MQQETTNERTPMDTNLRPSKRRVATAMIHPRSRRRKEADNQMAIPPNPPRYLGGYENVVVGKPGIV